MPTGQLSLQKVLIQSYIIISVATLLYILILTPVMGWDALDHWIPQSISAHTKSWSVYWAEYEVSLHSRHPAFIPTVWGWTWGVGGEMAAKLFFPCVFGLFLYLLPWMTAQLSSSRLLISVCFLLSVPLLQNHFMIFGYLEMLVTLFSGIAIAFGVGFFRSGSLLRLTCSIVSALFLLATKNVGIYYCSVLVGGLFIPLIYRSRVGRHAKILISLGAIFSVGFLASSVGLVSVNWANGELLSIDLTIFGFWQRLEMNEFTVVARNVVSALLIKSSFTLFIVLMILSILIVSKGFSRLLAADKAIIIYLATLLLAFIALPLLSVLLSKRGFLHSFPTSDTGFSRSILPVFSPYIFLFMLGLDRMHFGLLHHEKGESRFW